MAFDERLSCAGEVLLFGPQALSFEESTFGNLRAAIVDEVDNQWMRRAVFELPAWLERFGAKLPQLAVAEGQRSLEDLHRWLETGALPPTAKKLPNLLLTPLVVLTQLTQYSRYLRFDYQSAQSGDPYGQHGAEVRTLGFCTGLLSALAVSSTSSVTDFERYGSVAIRLAVLIGGVVDAQEASGEHGESKSFATAWTSAEQAVVMRRILEKYPEAYISVNYDEHRATVTTAAKTASSLQSDLRDAGLIAQPVSLRGRFHCNCYSHHLEALFDLCDSIPELQLPDASKTIVPIHSITGGDVIEHGKLHHIALSSILVEQSQWHSTFDAVYSSTLSNRNSILIGFGLERCVPPSFAKGLDHQIIYVSDWADASARLSARRVKQSYSDNDIAVIGMSVKVAGADDLPEFWDLLCRGESQHIEVPKERFTFDTHWRDQDPKRKWFGNFVRDHDAFDHKFFKKSPREMTSVDPQQRLMLQSAYQAVEQSGYFNSPNADPRVGVFVGVCAADYENNIACYPPNAFSATGNLKSFIAGKISHYFGWTGPGLTIDTACSASAVAVHQACRAILGGECKSALAGGTTIMTSPLWFQNLAGASFLSPTGACKPFDAKADGYCRGEAVSSVMLKKMSDAVRDGDPVYGCIRSTAVFQNENCTPIFVPNAPSLSGLFETVVQKAGLKPKDISLVEAHGTGTPVGDPAEYESILRVLGGPSVRSRPIPLGSVKGLVGHTECASGVIALIKTLMLIQEGKVPPQASFTTLSPGLKASPSDMLEVVTKVRPWDTDYRAALINNYGASGSNASMIVTQTPQQHDAGSFGQDDGIKHPFWLTAYDERSLVEYAAKLKTYLATKPLSPEKLTLANLSMAVFRQSNRNLEKGAIFSSTSVAQLEEKLTSLIGGDKSTITSRKSNRSVIFCFGGQTSRTIGLDQKLYDHVTVFRKHLDKCNAYAEELGFGGIFPEIFSKSPIEDTVRLQTVLFAFQYSCAMAWIDCGVKVEAVVGHSFGELTALAVTGVLSARDTMRVIGARSQLVRDSWGSEKGAMMAAEGDLQDVHRLLTSASQTCSGEPTATVACFNGPRSFTLAGTNTAIDAVANIVSSFPSVRVKKLAVSNAFHSTLVEPLLPGLQQIGTDLTFNKPSIYWERATETFTNEPLSSQFFASHMREPVYANQSFQRLHEKFPDALWLEAGSNSTITNMASKALGAPKDACFQAMNIIGDNGLSNLADVGVSLWKEGLSTLHWTHHSSQASAYAPLVLPPYQFEKSRHWLELKKPERLVIKSTPVQPRVEEMPTELYTFTGYQDDAKRHARFRINTMIKKYEDYVSGHLIVQTAPICPATLEVDMAIEALLSLRPDFEASKLQPGIHNVVNQSPICIDASRLVWLNMISSDSEGHVWDWEYASTDSSGSSSMIHVKGEIIMRASTDHSFVAEFARFERLVNYNRCHDLLTCSDPDDVIQGRNMYKTFAEIVDYGEEYRGLQKLVGKNSESAGRVLKTHGGDTWLGTHLADCFSQVGGFWVNCMTDRSPNDMYIAAGFESWIRSPKAPNPTIGTAHPEVWDILACHHQTSDKAYTTDIFIFNAETRELHEVILGINYAKIPKASMSKMLKRLTADGAVTAASPSVASKTVPPSTEEPEVITSGVKASNDSSVIIPEEAKNAKVASKKPKSDGPDVTKAVCEILADLSGLDLEAINSDSKLGDLGIDSLMGMEMAHELEAKFKCELNMDELAEVTTVADVIRCVKGALGSSTPDEVNEAESSDDDAHTPTGSNSPHSEPESMTSVSSAEEPRQNTKPVVATTDLSLPPTAFLEAFGETKVLTDQYIRDFKCAGYLENIYPKQIQLCVALAIEAFEKLGCPLRAARPGQKLERITHAPQHGRLAEYLYDMLEKEARLIDVDGDNIVRTSIAAPPKSASETLQGLVSDADHAYANKLTYYCGTRLADVLLGKLDGVKLIFGAEEGRELVAGLYGDSLLNKLDYKLMEDFVTRLASKVPCDGGPLKILEMGAGTGGTTKYLVPLLAKLEVPVEYTFTDLAPSFVAAARKKFKPYPFMKFRAHDIEAVPADDLIGTQHLIVASNAVHATHSLTVSGENIRKALRPDGCLLMLEMTQTLYWVDVIFGLLEGWWLFDDGRRHAISSESRWERELQSVGFGHVDWTDGHLPENKIQRIILAFASGPKHDRLPLPVPPTPMQLEDTSARGAAVDDFIRKYTEHFAAPQPSGQVVDTRKVVLITGATGSLGSHLVQYFAESVHVAAVVCLNRASRSSVPEARQREALHTRGIHLSPEASSKLTCLETDTSGARMGLASKDYEHLLENVTHIVHNAWPMSGKRPLRGFESQFRVLRNLLDLSTAIATSRESGFQVTFQFISSIAVVGHYPLWSGDVNVPENRMTIDSVLPNGYGDAKLVCEKMIEATLEAYPSSFRAMSVRLGQVAGSKTTGYWNPLEHLSFLIKSSQTLRALPDFDGVLSWTPVNDVASILGELIISPQKPHPIYHIDNPVRQPWREMTPVLAEALNIPIKTGIIPFKDWVRRVRNFPGSVENDNPAFKLIDFLDDNFIRMSCGGLLLGTEKTREHSKTLAELGPVSEKVAKGYIRYWKEVGFLR